MNKSSVPGLPLASANSSKNVPNSWGTWAYRKYCLALSKAPSLLVDIKGAEVKGGETMGRRGKLTLLITSQHKHCLFLRTQVNNNISHYTTDSRFLTVPSCCYIYIASDFKNQTVAMTQERGSHGFEKCVCMCITLPSKLLLAISWWSLGCPYLCLLLTRLVHLCVDTATGLEDGRPKCFSCFEHKECNLSKHMTSVHGINATFLSTWYVDMVA